MFKQRRVPAKARRKTYAWSGDGVGADYDEDEPEERHRASDRVGFDGWHVPVPPGVDPAEPVPEAPPSKKLLLIRNGRRGFGTVWKLYCGDLRQPPRHRADAVAGTSRPHRFGLPEELVERCLAFVTPRDRLNIFGEASRVAMRAAREPRWFLPRASRLARKLNSQLRAQMALVNEQMTVVSDSQARVRHFETCLRSVERKLDDRRREFRAHREKPPVTSCVEINQGVEKFA